MNTQLEEEKYFVVKNFVSEEVLQLCQSYYAIKFFVKKDFVSAIGNITEDAPDIVQPCSIYSYADPLTESLLINYLPAMREITGIDTLEPTYSFTRLYETGQWLGKHSDRPSCQYSITLPLVAFDDTPWIIYMEDKEIDLQLGDLVIYKGCEAQHWREPFEGKYQIQAHLHYVDAAEPAYKPYVMDGRASIGLEK